MNPKYLGWRSDFPPTHPIGELARRAGSESHPSALQFGIILAMNSAVLIIPTERNIYVLRSLPNHLARAESWDKLSILLTDISFVAAKITHLGVNSLLQDYLLLKHLDRDLTLFTLFNSINQNSHLLARCNTIGEVYSNLSSSLVTHVDLFTRLERSSVKDTAFFLVPLSPTSHLHEPHLIKTFTGKMSLERAETNEPAVCAISTKTHRAVISAMRGIVRVWNIQSGEEVLTIQSESWKPDNWPWPNCSINSLGSVIAFMSGYDCVEIWSVDERHRYLRYSASNNEKIYSCHVLFSGDYTVVAGTFTRIIKSRSGEEVACFPGREKPVLLQANSNYAISPCFDHIAVIDDANNTIVVLDISENRQLLTLKQPQGRVNYITYNSTGDWLLSASSDGCVEIWDSITGQAIRQVESNSPILYCSISPDNKHILVASQIAQNHFSRLKWYLLHLQENHFSEVKIDTGEEFTAIGSSYIFATGNRSIAIFENISGKLLYRGITGQEVFSIKVAPNGENMLAAQKAGNLQLWQRPKTNQKQRDRTLKGHIAGERLIITAKKEIDRTTQDIFELWQKAPNMIENLAPARFLILGSAISGEIVVCYDILSEQIIVLYMKDNRKLVLTGSKYPSDFWGNNFAISQYGKFVAYSLDKQQLQILNTLTKATIAIPSVDSKRGLVCCVFSPSERYFAAAWDNTLKIWTTTNWELIRVIENDRKFEVGRSIGFNQVVFDPGETMVLTSARTGLGTQVFGYEDIIYKAWDLNSGHELYRLEGHEGWVGGCAFSQNGQYIATTSSDKSIKIWKVDDGSKLTGIYLDNAISACLFHPDNKNIVAGKSYYAKSEVQAQGNQLNLHFFQLT